jgi:hypothetical protein
MAAGRPDGFHRRTAYGRYTHKVAISDYRIRAIENSDVTFRYRDRSDGDTEKMMKLSAEVFIARFLLHILPPIPQNSVTSPVTALAQEGHHAVPCPCLPNKRSHAVKSVLPDHRATRYKYQA